MVGAALGAPDKLPEARQQKQLDTIYGSPSQAAPVAYGAPSEIEETLAGYGDDGLEAQASALDESLADAQGGGDPLDMLMKAVPGIPGEDYPIYAEAPETSFTCEGQVNGGEYYYKKTTKMNIELKFLKTTGYYADPEAECQAFHICTADAEGGLAKYSFLCPNGTIFNQEYFICDWWFNVDCSEAAALAAEGNAALQAAREEADAQLAAAASEQLEVSAAPGGYLAAEASAPIASYGAASENTEEELAGYNSFRF